VNEDNNGGVPLRKDATKATKAMNVSLRMLASQGTVKSQWLGGKNLAEPPWKKTVGL